MADFIRWASGALVGLVLVVAGTIKAAGPARWTAEASALGVPSVVVRGLPVVEVDLGALVIVGVGRPWPALAALALLMVFTGVLARVVGRDDAPSCACFGGWSQRPIGPRHLIRNAVLIVAAVIAVTA